MADIDYIGRKVLTRVQKILFHGGRSVAHEHHGGFAEADTGHGRHIVEIVIAVKRS